MILGTLRGILYKHGTDNWSEEFIRSSGQFRELSNGKVYLVGAGPGDPGLLTLRGREVLESADLVLYDGLVNPLLLNLTTARAERTARTRLGDGRIVPQEDINARLVAEAKAGQTVVRLKGGDPYIFGRGSEEAAALEAAGIEYEVVPGITAATAAGEYAGFSFTHRDIASAVAFITGHEDPTRDNSRVDYAALAAFPGTLIFYMGLGRVERICNQLITNGKADHTPAAVICRASLATQRVVTGTLANLPDVVSESGLTPPSLIVVGECVDLRHAASWFEQRPLFGLRIGVTRPANQFQSVADEIVRQSGQPVKMPLIQISDLSHQQFVEAMQNIARVKEADWLIFTSVNGVHGFFRLLFEFGYDARSLADAKLASIGWSTVRTLEDYCVRADCIPDSFRAEALAETLAPDIDGKTVFWARASRGREVLPEMLREAGANVVETVVYNNEDVSEFPPDTVELIRTGGLDWVGLSSPSIARQFAALLKQCEVNPLDAKIKLASISPVTSATARESGLRIDAEATTYTWNGMIEAIAQATRETT